MYFRTEKPHRIFFLFLTDCGAIWEAVDMFRVQKKMTLII